MNMPRWFRFGLVGAGAAAVHFCVVWLLVERFRMAPLAANVLAFLVAFCVSYMGHARLTFADAKTTVRESLPHFFAVAVSAFACNELLYFIALHGLKLPYRPALFAVLLLVAAGTYAASRLWAFAGGAGRPS